MKYVYVGGGMGVPGLPHEISDEEAKERGVGDLLRQAVKNGNYVEADHKPLRLRSTRPDNMGSRSAQRDANKKE